MQTKKQSFIESLSNVFVGYVISLISLFIIFPILGIESSVSKNILITLYFTVISIARSYLLRRYYNTKTHYVKRFTGFADITGNKIYDKDYLLWLDCDLEELGCSLNETKQQVYWCTLNGAWMLDTSYKQDNSEGSLLGKELQNFRYKKHNNN